METLKNKRAIVTDGSKGLGLAIVEALLAREAEVVAIGQEFEVERLDRGDYRLVRRIAPRNEGALDWLLACPHKDFFVPIDSESTDTL